ncbi:nascent polypeptide-associated complex subunit alpha, muscle-specific form-like isoform X8 [Hyposmocoma kahamanoa]|uniref:nascent polypeptide-associated complex subunit alpha, muscle-specific form-like isoform X8 n=1 Tax=Hyposmocoma kahamanoa TaxID=1477025 RepID=UPI000E6D8B89|nr:nascent polypeptide-associated complex subunit alpha, muscle-specific form-like isoform X8 [Hyposmocoma kahamanoa]
MSEEMAVGDKATGEEPKVNGEEAVVASAVNVEGSNSEQTSDPVTAEPGETSTSTEAVTPDEPSQQDKPEESHRGTKRRASAAFSDDGEFRGFNEVPSVDQFKGFEKPEDKDVSRDYGKVLERLEAEVTAARKSFTPVKTVMASPAMLLRASKRARQDTDGSRPSSALSSRSDGEAALTNEQPVGPQTRTQPPVGAQVRTGASAASSPAARRRATTEMSSPLLRVPLERGWKRELVYRAALDAHSRRNADIYYYTPQGKKLRSTREVAEHLTGTGLTLENFSFFKESVGIDDPEKEIIRDAKLMRRVESPVSSPAPVAIEGKRTPKPKPPKGASPEHNTPKSPPAKIRVKSVGSRLSNSSTTPAASAKNQKKTPADNNNSAAWKKPRQPAPAAPPPALAGPESPAATTATLVPVVVTTTTAPVVAETPTTVSASRAATPPQPPPPLQSRPQQQTSPDIKSPRQVVQPCSMTCGRGVPTLSCAACLCMYHPACAGYVVIPPPPSDSFYCKNCRKSTSPPLEPPPLIHKSGVASNASTPPISTPVPRRVPLPVPVPVPVPVPAKVRPDKRVLLRMKVAGGGPDGERVWAVAKPQSTAKPQPPPPKPLIVPRPQATPRALALRASLPQSLAILNGRRFIIVPRSMVQPPHP